MGKSWRFLLGVVSAVVVSAFFLFLVNQTYQVVNLAARLNPLLGQVLLWFLVLLYGLLFLVALLLFFRLPGSLPDPPAEDSPQYSKYFLRLIKRLQKNPYLRERSISNRKEVESALAELDRLATEDIKQTAKTVFLSTAISQSGRLDGLFVLVMLSRLIWRVAHIYYQRPALRQILQLYANVAGTVFASVQLEDLDVSEQIEPVVGSVMGSTLAQGIPGVGMVTAILTNSLMNGAANAFLTLRVGIIARQYCSPVVKKEKRKIRQLASVEASRLLGAIVVNSAGKITRAIVGSAVKAPRKGAETLMRSAFRKFHKGGSDSELPAEE